MVGKRAHLKPTIAFVFPWSCAVSTNNRTIPVRRRQILSPEYRTALKEAGNRALHQHQGPMLEGPVYVWVKVYQPDGRRRDASNYEKLIHDALQGVAYADDRQIKDSRCTDMGIDRDSPRIEVTVEEL